MNKEELTAMVAEILQGLGREPAVKAADYRNTAPEPEKKDCGYADGDFVPDVTALDLRKLYLVENPADGEKFKKMKLKTPARLGCGKAGPRYKTLTMLRFRADHAAAQDAVFSEVDTEFAKENDLLPTKTRCDSKDEYLTRPDLGRCFDEHNAKAIKGVIDTPPRVQLVVGDGLSSAAITANAMDCLAAIRDGLKLKGIETGKAIFVKYCRVGAGDAIGDITGCELVCMLVGERPGLVTDKSMSAYITYKPHTGVSESSRTVVSNIHAQGTPAVEAGAYVAELIDTILKRKVSGVGLHLEEAK
ncbi:MAG: ethanolamine ammonia-lyase subunit EutC [Oscillospiraceae bacterium]|nr:ethanolamine ammonia-lyase subunit EutC [Oscillospiraceae bacterium]